MQKRLFAIAVAGILAAPAAIADVAISGSTRMMVQYDGSEISLTDGWSRLRFNASNDLGNGQSVFAKHEFGVNIGMGHIKATAGQRVTVIGLKGDWGSFALGSQWDTGTKVIWKSCPHWNYGCIGGMNNGRMQNSARYDGQVGPFGFAADVVAASDIDQAGVVLTYDVGSVSLAGGYESRDGADNWSGVGGSMSLGDVGLGAYFNEVGTDDGWSATISMLGFDVQTGAKNSASEHSVGYTAWSSGGAKFRVEVHDGDNAESSGVGILRFDY